MASISNNDVVKNIVSKYFDITNYSYDSKRRYYTFMIRERRSSINELEDCFKKLYKELVQYSYYPIMRVINGVPVLRVIISSRADPIRERFKALILLIATFVTVWFTGYGLASSFPSESPYTTALEFLVALLFPLGLHELGHYIASRRYNTPTSLPYFLPGPPIQLGFLGTFGAIINMRWLPPSLQELAVIGITGPLMGVIAAIPFAIHGLSLSPVLPPEMASHIGGELRLSPLIFLLLAEEIKKNSEGIIVLHPVAFAAYIVFLVTFLNLLPVAQLDGGHIIRAVLGEKMHFITSWAIFIILLVASLAYKPLILLVFFVLIILMLTRGRHIGAAGLEDLSISSFKLALVFTIYLILFALTIPLPV